jgi:hypothetical protein
MIDKIILEIYCTYKYLFFKREGTFSLKIRRLFPIIIIENKRVKLNGYQ